MHQEHIEPRWWRHFYVAWAGFALFYGAIQASSVIMEHMRAGLPIALWEPIVNEYTGVLSLVLMLPLIRRIDAVCPIQRDTWRVAVPVHVLMSVPVALLQVAVFVAARKLLHPLFGAEYTLGDIGFELVYEYRKLGLGYAVGLGSLYAFGHYAQLRRLLNMPDAVAPPPQTAPALPQPNGTCRFLARHGYREVIVNAADVRYVEAAGNYVVLHTRRGEMKLRDTLSNLADQLVDAGFVRVHRSYLVNLDAVREIQPWFHGDQRVVLDDGTMLNLSRRYRDAIRLRTVQSPAAVSPDGGP